MEKLSLMIINLYRFLKYYLSLFHEFIPFLIIKILRKRQEEAPIPYERPWQGKLEKFVEAPENNFVVEYSSEDDTFGNVAVGWRVGRKISEDIEGLEAYNLIMKYLTTTQVTRCL